MADTLGRISGRSALAQAIRYALNHWSGLIVGAVADAVAAGELSSEEGAAVAGILEAQRRAVETVEMEARIAALEQSREAPK